MDSREKLRDALAALDAAATDQHMALSAAARAAQNAAECEAALETFDTMRRDAAQATATALRDGLPVESPLPGLTARRAVAAERLDMAKTALAALTAEAEAASATTRMQAGQRHEAAVGAAMEEVDLLARRLLEIEWEARHLRCRLASWNATWFAPEEGAPKAAPCSDLLRRVLNEPPANVGVQADAHQQDIWTGFVNALKFNPDAASPLVPCPPLPVPEVRPVPKVKPSEPWLVTRDRLAARHDGRERDRQAAETARQAAALQAHRQAMEKVRAAKVKNIAS